GGAAAGEPVAEDRDPALEEPLLVLGGVVLEILGQVAEAPGGLDRLDGLGPLRALELGQLRLEGLLLRLRHMFGLLDHRPQATHALSESAPPTGEWSRPSTSCP